VDLIKTNERWRSRLPHWEVDGHWHFVTIRCKDSLPKVALERILQIYKAMQAIDPQHDEFCQLQRQYFLTIEKYLDQGRGRAPFRSASACELCLKALAGLEKEGWVVAEATVMPNHIHFLIRRGTSTHSLKEIVKRFKGRSSRWLNQELDVEGKFWQADWFDRWMRNESELKRTVDYIRNNPVKAKLVNEWVDYRWRISRDWVWG